MSETKHTPGPWAWMDVNQAVPYDENHGEHGYDGLFVCRGGTEDETRVLQAIMPVDSLSTDHPYRLQFEDKTSRGAIVIDNPADARLIAAAPELLAACQRAAKSEHHPACKCHGVYSANPEQYCTCHVQVARAAIAKAKGVE